MDEAKRKLPYATKDEIMNAIVADTIDALRKAKTVTYGRLTESYEFIKKISKNYKNGNIEALIKQMHAEGQDSPGIRGKKPVAVGDTQDRKIQRPKNKSGQTLPPSVAIPLHTLVKDDDQNVTVEYKPDQIIIRRKK